MLAAAIGGAVLRRRSVLVRDPRRDAAPDPAVRPVVRIRRAAPLFHDPHPAAARGRGVSAGTDRGPGDCEAMTKHKIAIIVGSLRKGSINRKVAQAMCAISSRQARLHDRRDRRPAALQPGPRQESARGVGRVSRAGRRRPTACCSCTPEYNRSVPGVLKNAIDVGSRPYGKSVFDKKPAAIVSRLARRDRRVRRQPPFAPGVRVPRHAGDAAARSLSRPRHRRQLRRRRLLHRRAASRKW